MKYALRNRTCVSIAVAIVLLASIMGVWLLSEPGEVSYGGDGVRQDTPETQQTFGSLGEHKCLSLFKVERLNPSTDYLVDAEMLVNFQSFPSGAFFGRVEDYHPSNASGFSSLIDELMMEGDIRTYEHLSAEVCLYSEDVLNPEGGATLRYFVEHYYCTNECQTGTYSIRVDLKSDGYFVGYREVSKWE
jgi:hypothetical protein